MVGPKVFHFKHSRSFKSTDLHHDPSTVLNLLTTWIAGHQFETKIKGKAFSRGKKRGIHINHIPKFKLWVSPGNNGTYVVTLDYYAKVKLGTAAVFGVLTSGISTAVGVGTLAITLAEADVFVEKFWKHVESYSRAPGVIMFSERWIRDDHGNLQLHNVTSVQPGSVVVQNDQKIKYSSTTYSNGHPVPVTTTTTTTRNAYGSSSTTSVNSAQPIPQGYIYPAQMYVVPAAGYAHPAAYPTQPVYAYQPYPPQHQQPYPPQHQQPYPPQNQQPYPPPQSPYPQPNQQPYPQPQSQLYPPPQSQQNQQPSQPQQHQPYPQQPYPTPQPYPYDNSNSNSNSNSNAPPKSLLDDILTPQGASVPEPPAPEADLDKAKKGQQQSYPPANPPPYQPPSNGYPPAPQNGYPSQPHGYPPQSGKK